MQETQPFKVPPVVPVDVPLEGRTQPIIKFGRNTKPGKIGLEIRLIS